MVTSPGRSSASLAVNSLLPKKTLRIQRGKLLLESEFLAFRGCVSQINRSRERFSLAQFLSALSNATGGSDSVGPNIFVRPRRAGPSKNQLAISGCYACLWFGNCGCTFMRVSSTLARLWRVRDWGVEPFYFITSSKKNGFKPIKYFRLRGL